MGQYLNLSQLLDLLSVPDNERVVKLEMSQPTFNLFTVELAQRGWKKGEGIITFLNKDGVVPIVGNEKIPPGLIRIVRSVD